MASASPFTGMEQEAQCPICLECLTDPMIVDCGHSFCQGCIAKHCETWEELGEALECPSCKDKIQKGNFRPNWQLANLVRQIKLLPPNPQSDELCMKHKEKLHLFCKEDEELMCWICKKSPEHKSHTLLLPEEATQEYKDKIFSSRETLRTEKQKILGYLANAEYEGRAMLKEMESKKQRTVADFRTLHQWLKKLEKQLLSQIEEMEKEVARKREEYVASLSEELSSLENLMQEMEEKLQQPACELLKDVRSTLQQYEMKEAFENPKAFPSELKRKVENCCFHDIFLDRAMKQYRATVILDPASASPCLVLPGNQRYMTWQSTAEDLSEDPEKHYGFVLGSEGFTTGCHFWDVTGGEGQNWVVGVARGSLKGRVPLTPEEGIWAVGRWKGQYKAFIKGIDPPLTLSGELNGIRVCLNYEEGRVVFFSTYTAAHLFEFSGISFSGETLQPFFALYDKGLLRLSP